MCGIVGYIGDGSAAPAILDGLRALEYRGYDSAGIAVLTPQGLSVRRRAGRIRDLARLIDDDLMSGAIGIGHTRWATHGAVTDANAHPHADASGRLVIVHNGMTDNVADLRAELLADGHVFSSETDTEVIAHLIGAQRDAGSSLTDAVGRTLRRLAGAHSVVALAADEPDLLVGGRVGSAGGLIVGHGASEAFLASDLPAVVRHTRDFQVVEAGEIVALRSDGARLSRPAQPLPPTPPDLGALGADGGGQGRPPALHAQGDPRTARNAGRHDSPAGHVGAGGAAPSRLSIARYRTGYRARGDRGQWQLALCRNGRHTLSARTGPAADHDRGGLGVRLRPGSAFS